jgi:outer membrane protein assembly factor BamD (BamD/ComL family)
MKTFKEFCEGYKTPNLDAMEAKSKKLYDKGQAALRSGNLSAATNITRRLGAISAAANLVRDAD